jgi:GGDEF domain-containing protein
LLDAPAAAAAAFAERVLAATREIAIAGGSRLTASAGVATAPADARTIDALLHVADERLLTAKTRGKDRVQTAG